MHVQVSRLEAELKKEKDAKSKMLHTRTASPDSAREDTCTSMTLSRELESLKVQLAVEVEEKKTLQHEMSLVVSGKKDIVERQKVISDLQAEVHDLKKAIEEKDSNMKRQYQVLSHTIADLQAKLSKERQTREDLLQSAKKESGPPGPASFEGTTTSRDTAASMTAALQEKDGMIQQLTQQLQTFAKTARNVAKLTEHTKQQSETIVVLKADLQQAQVHVIVHVYCSYTTNVYMYVYLHNIILVHVPKIFISGCEILEQYIYMYTYVYMYMHTGTCIYTCMHLYMCVIHCK